MVIDDNNLILTSVTDLISHRGWRKYSVINNLEEANLNYRVSEVKDQFSKISVEDVSHSRIHQSYYFN